MLHYIFLFKKKLRTNYFLWIKVKYTKKSKTIFNVEMNLKNNERSNRKN